MTKEQAVIKVQSLIERYNSLTPGEKKMNEEMTKARFIRPLFESLGWNFEEDVLLEDNISNGRVDYNLQINGRTKFFLEAKPLKADLDSFEYSKQATNYAWLKNVNWAVLTDFEGIRIFYPAERGQAKACLRLDMKDYIPSFDDLWVLSKESFQKDLIDLQAVKWGAKPEQIKVGQQLAEDMNTWRKSLSNHFKTWNKLQDKDLDEGVQKILDRFIFIRSCEDRMLENDSLRSKYRIWQEQGRKGNFLAHLKPFFAEYKKNYNSGLFDDHPVMDWEISSECFDEIINGLYRSKNGQEYDFSIIDADVLGSVYEQYLGHLLQKSDDGDTSKKKRKSQGIYYTPTFIVDYIVNNTLGKMLQEKSPQEIAHLKILDPACGSGSFLIKAFDLLTDYYYLQKVNEKFDTKTKIGKLQQAFRKRDGVGELPVSQKMSILRNNIYGVDLDEQAVEIAQLNLLLKTLEKKQELPHLSNIKIGNSLIDDPTIAGEYAFNWNERFPGVMKDGGFDVIIGNPPYIKEYVNKSAFDGLHTSPYYQGKMDIWTLFACKAIDLLKDGGCFSFIAPNNWLTNAGASIFRNKILSEGEIVSFIDFGDYRVFEEAGIQTMVFVFQKKKPEQSYKVLYEKIVDKNISTDKLIASLNSAKSNQIDGIEIETVNLQPDKMLNKSITFSSDQRNELLDKIESRKNFILQDNEVAQGIVGAPDQCFIAKNISNFTDEEKKYLKTFHTSASRYFTNQSPLFIFYISEKNFKNNSISNYPNIEHHFKPYKNLLQASKVKYGTPNKPYYYLHRERDEKFFLKGAKIVSQSRVANPSFCYTEDEYYGSRALNYIITDRINLRYLTALLNSRLTYFWLKNRGKQLGDLLQIDKGPLTSIPILTASIEKETKVVELVNKIIELNKVFSTVEKNTNRWNQINTEIQKTDDLIDQKVYELYGLNNKEVEIIEKVNS